MMKKKSLRIIAFISSFAIIGTGIEISSVGLGFFGVAMVLALCCNMACDH